MPFLVHGAPEPVAPVDSRIGRRRSPDPINALREVLNRGALSDWPHHGEAFISTQEGSVELAQPPQPGFYCTPSNPLLTEPHAEFGVFSKKQAELLQEFSTPREYRLLKLGDHSATSSRSKMVAYLLEKERKRAFGINFMSLQAHRSPVSCKPGRRKGFWTPDELKKWSAPLALPTRVRVAKALLIIRKEKARQKERALLGPDEDEEQIWIDFYASRYRKI
jgi:hypothetical protein